MVRTSVTECRLLIGRLSRARLDSARFGEVQCSLVQLAVLVETLSSLEDARLLYMYMRDNQTIRDIRRKRRRLAHSHGAAISRAADLEDA